MGRQLRHDRPELPGHRARHHLDAGGEYFPGGRTNSETIIISTPGSVFQPRYNQVDMNLKKNFRHGTRCSRAQFDLFNVTEQRLDPLDQQRQSARRSARSLGAEGPHAADRISDEVLMFAKPRPVSRVRCVARRVDGRHARRPRRSSTRRSGWRSAERREAECSSPAATATAKRTSTSTRSAATLTTT